jgi:hypothetical protein
MLHAAEFGIWPVEFKLKYDAKYRQVDKTHRRLAPNSAAHKYLNGDGAMGAASDALRWFQEAMSERPDWEIHEVRYKADGKYYGTDYDIPSSSV